ncbi:hypothetical protein ACQUWY_24865, partial [Ralstonia pseudosolanacearum]
MGSSPPRLVVSEHAPAAAADTGTRAAPRRPLAGVPVKVFPNPGKVPTEFMFGDRIDRYSGS